MAKFVRASHFRHIFGTNPKREDIYDNVRISENSWEGSPLCAVNPKFFAVCLKSAGGGAFLVLPHDKTGRVEQDAPKVTGHGGDVLDIAWNPFNDNMIASSSEDMKVMIWEIPDTGLSANLSKPLLTLANHQRRVGIIKWHPTAEHILLSASHDNKICIWNLDTGDCEVEIKCHIDTIFSVDWNFDGSLIATSCKDKNLRIIDPRNGDIVKVSKGHEGSKPQQIAFLGETNALFTTGFSKMSERQYALWSKDLEKQVQEDIDQSNGVQFIRYDPDINIVWLIGRGDCIIRYYEVNLGTVEDPKYECFWLANYTGKESQRGFGFMPKRGCGISRNEVANIFRCTKTNIQPVSFVVPRKSELFQHELFPDTNSGEPSITAEEWVGGKNAPPKLMPCEPLFHGKGSSKTTPKKKTAGLGGLKKAGGGAAKKPTPGAAKEEEVDVPKLLATVKSLTEKVSSLEKTTAELTKRVESLEASNDQAEDDME